MTVEFKFTFNQIVVTSLGEPGLIDTCGVGSGGTKRYYVQMKEGRGAWYDEDQLTAL